MNRKLSYDQIIAVKKRLRDSAKMRDVAKDFGVTYQTIWLIATNKIHAEITIEEQNV